VTEQPSPVPPPAAHRPLVLRLAIPLALAVVVVLLLVGLLVNRVVSRGFEETLSAQQQERLEFATNALTELMQLPPRRGVVQGMQRTLRQIATQSGGEATLRDAEGDVVAQSGRKRPDLGPTKQLDQPLVADGERVGTLTIEVPAAAPQRTAFLGVFNLTLLIAGIAAVVALVGLAALLADRLTRPLRGVAAAARRLEAGDLSTRATGGPDAESAELAEAFNAMAGRLERSEVLRRRAASDMAHDLATPATLLESQLQAMVDEVVPADREQLERARSAATALSGVIVQLGELASAEAAPLQRRAEPIEVASALREVERSMEALSRERGVSVRVDALEGVRILADESHFARVVRNVVTNAVQHTPKGGQVRVDAVGAGARVEIRVSDEGPGIAAEDVPHVFERFYRADPSRAPTGERVGSGIGLTIARELLAANGGSIVVESTGSRGTTFLIVLPAA
jgi:two-component system sensor histidine kinase BaeS